ncbi:19.5g4 protein [Bracoviriform inaniti]|uniref:19.5g4 protein n=1 Tax=Bracoviriform inaniti TaxID=36344 RepID=A8E0Z9_9VIRU|nr:19.5g4 protein [Bracoviriform inaniti]CAO98969.1 19.5g4 protein [Bracoviriform inaniti]
MRSKNPTKTTREESSLLQDFGHKYNVEEHGYTESSLSEIHCSRGIILYLCQFVSLSRPQIWLSSRRRPLHLRSK